MLVATTLHAARAARNFDRRIHGGVHVHDRHAAQLGEFVPGGGFLPAIHPARRHRKTLREHFADRDAAAGGSRRRMFRRNWQPSARAGKSCSRWARGPAACTCCAGTGGAINAWSEISAMATALVMTLALHPRFVDGHCRTSATILWLSPVIFAKTTLATTGITTAGVGGGHAADRAEPGEVLVHFYRKVRPIRCGWQPIAKLAASKKSRATWARILLAGSWVRCCVCGAVLDWPILFWTHDCGSGVGVLRVGVLWCGIVSALCPNPTSGASSRMTATVRKAGNVPRRSRGIPWMDARRVRLLRDCFPDTTRWRGISRRQKSHHLYDHRHAGDSAGGRVAVWRADRSLRPAHSADGQRRLLFRGRSGLRILTQLHRFPDYARALWHRHGRRVGHRRFAGHGIGAASLARNPLRNFAERLLHRVYTSGDRRAHRCCRRGAGGRCSGWARCRRCWRCTSAPACRNRKPGNSIARQSMGHLLRVVATNGRAFSIS